MQKKTHRKPTEVLEMSYGAPETCRELLLWNSSSTLLGVRSVALLQVPKRAGSYTPNTIEGEMFIQFRRKDGSPRPNAVSNVDQISLTKFV